MTFNNRLRWYLLHLQHKENPHMSFPDTTSLESDATVEALLLDNWLGERVFVEGEVHHTELSRWQKVL